MDDLKVELGYALLPLVNAPDGSDRLTEQIRALRRSLAVELGFVMPAVRSLDNVQLDANSYVIKVKEVEAGSGKVWSGQYMVLDPGRRAGEIARHAHHRANFRTPGNMDRRRAQRGSVDEGLYGG
jgi:flagellar biosynthesis component FlhA